MAKSQVDKHVDIQLDRKLIDDVDYYVRQHSGVSKKAFFEHALRHELDHVHGDYSDPTERFARLNEILADLEVMIKAQNETNTAMKIGFRDVLNLLGSTGSGIDYLLKSNDSGDN